MAIRAIAELMYSDLTSALVKEAIDRVKIAGCNVVEFSFGDPSNGGYYISKYRTATTDPIKDNIAYATSQGIGIKFRMAHGVYGARETFYSNLTAQTALLNDFKWLVARYPSVMIYEMEEMHRYGLDAATAAACRAGYNALWLKIKAILAGKTFGFNTASSQYSSMMAQGVDIPFINANKVFSYYAVQATGISPTATNPNPTIAAQLSSYINEVNTTSSYFPGMEMRPWVYIQSSGFLNSPACQNDTTSPKPGCFNQGFFSQLKWLNDNGYSFGIFRGAWILNVPRDNFPGGSAYAGATLKDMIKSLLDGASPPPPPPPVKYNIVAQVSNMGLGVVRFNDDPTRQSSSSYGMSLDPGASYKITAIPASGYQFVKWTSSTNQIITSPSITGTATASIVYVADFSVAPVPVPQNAGLEKAFALIGGYLILKAIGVAK